MLNKVIIKHKQSSIHEEPLDNDLKFRFLEQTREVVSDKHLKSLFETGDKPTGVDFELFINSKVHQSDFKEAGKEIEDSINKVATDIREEISNTTVQINESINTLDEKLTSDILDHSSNEDIHFTPNEKEAVAKIDSLEQAIGNINTILGGTTRQHIVSTLEEMFNLENVLHADICYVLESKETYIYDKNDLVGDGDVSKWVKISSFDNINIDNVEIIDWTNIRNKPEEFNPTQHNHTTGDIEGLNELLEDTNPYKNDMIVTNTDISIPTKNLIAGSEANNQVYQVGVKQPLNNSIFTGTMAIQSTHGRPAMVLKVRKDGTTYSQLNISDIAVYPEVTETINLGSKTARFNYLYGSYVDVKSVGIADTVPTLHFVNKTNNVPYSWISASEDAMTVAALNTKLKLTSSQEISIGNDDDKAIDFCSLSSGYGVIPRKNSNVSLGTSSLRYKDLYLTTSPSVSSDRSLKHDINYIDKTKSMDVITGDEAYSFVKDIKFAEYKYNGTEDAVIGFIANDIIEQDKKVSSKFIREDSNGLLSYDVNSFTNTLGVALQKAMQKIENLEARIVELENK